MIQIPPPPFKTNVTDHTGQMTQTWQRHVLATQQTITTDAAPADARYVVATANPSLTAEVNLGALSAGYLKQAVAAGVASPSTTATIPADAIGALVNVTAVAPQAPGYVVVYPDSAGTHRTPPPAAGANTPQTVALKQDTVTFKLGPFEGKEYKYRMEKGAGFVYS